MHFYSIYSKPRSTKHPVLQTGKCKISYVSVCLTSVCQILLLALRKHVGGSEGLLPALAEFVSSPQVQRL